VHAILYLHANKRSPVVAAQRLYGNNLERHVIKWVDDHYFFGIRKFIIWE